MTLKIFISYAKENLSDALQYFNKLEELGLEPWLDEKKILPGEKWENAILDAFNNSQVIILLISSKSIDKRGFVQKEAKWALKKLEEKLDNDIYIIPIMIERCEVPTSISSIVQYIDGTRDESWMRIVSSLKKAAEQYGIPFSPEKEYGPYIVSTETLNDIWNGKPGYNTEIDYPIFQRIIEGILNENRRLSTPASIESPILFEKTIDIKGMGGSSAIKCEQVVKNIEEILAIELILATSLWKKKQFEHHSVLFKEYLSFMAEEEVTTLKKQIEHTIRFFEMNNE